MARGWWLGLGGIVGAIAIVIAIGLAQGWFNNDNYGDTVHPDGAFWSFTVPKHFITGSYGTGSRYSTYQGPPQGPDWSYIQLSNADRYDWIYVDVIHGQPEAAGPRLLADVERHERDLLPSGDTIGGFALTSVAEHPAVSWHTDGRTASGSSVGRTGTWIQHGSDAAIVTCEWRSDQGDAQRVAAGCRAVLASWRFTS